MSVNLLSFVEVMKVVREWALSSYKILQNVCGIVEKNFVIRTNAFVT